MCPLSYKAKGFKKLQTAHRDITEELSQEKIIVRNVLVEQIKKEKQNNKHIIVNKTNK